MLTSQTKLKIIKLYNEGNTIREIADEIGGTYYYIRKVLIKHSVPLKPRGFQSYFNDEEIEEIAYRVEHGEMQTKIADEYGVHKTTISNLLKRKGYR